MKIEVFENIKKLFPFITLWILLLSACKELIYYNGFGIMILHYMELSELTYLFLDDIMIWAFFLILLISFSLTNNIDKKLSIQNHPFNRFYTYVFIFTVLSIFVVTDILEDYVENMNLYFIAITILISSFLIYLLPRFKNSYIGKFGVLVPMSFVLVYFVAKFKQASLMDGSSDSKSIITFESNDVYSNSNSFYIGQTKGYLFFYDKEKEESTIYAKNKISKMTFSN
ncbi:hypothetical protein [Aquimarina sp. MMG016]|uniref:hypothetical protein n=1 Tax=Aquimarina sp. MMG016 TaxID=2822690 RepID=UPI001B3A55B7|nr:hypothetical protein [Aquimarina sp. MMG016]MBQ4818888.1 hypothetical protein [Aquimarina sp. MMG016]